MKATKALVLITGFTGGLLVGATSQAIRLAIAEKQTTPQTPAAPIDLPAFLKETADDSPSTGSQVVEE